MQSQKFTRWIVSICCLTAFSWNLPTVAQTNDERSIIASFTMDEDPGWTTEGQWAFGVSEAGSYGAPTSGYTGTNVYGFNLDGDYTVDDGDFWLTTGPIDCSGYTNISFSFCRLLSVISPDIASIEVSHDGENWEQVWSSLVDSALWDLNGWVKVSYDISANADGQSTVYLRWGMTLSSGNNWPLFGWNIDDVEISGIQSCQLALSIPSEAVEGDGSLVDAGEVTLYPAAESNLVVSLTAEDGAEISVPEEVIIPAGATNASFDITVLDDSLLDGSCSALLHVSADGCFSASAAMVVHDDESAVLSVSLPATTYEGAGSIAGSLQVDTAPDADVMVELISNNPGEIGNGSVTIPAGQTLVSFTLPVLDDDLLDGLQTATVTAQVENWQSGQASVFVIDNEEAGLALQLPASVLESDGVVSNGGLLSVSATLTRDVTVMLNSSDTGELQVPQSVVIPAGTNQVTFDVTAIDDAEMDGAATVSVLAESPGYLPAAGNVTVYDDEPHHIVMDCSAWNIPLFEESAVTVSVYTVDNEPVYGAVTELTLSAEGDRGAVGVSPEQISVSNGFANVNLAFNDLGNDVVLTASGAGISGTSMVFNVTGSQIVISPASFTNEQVAAGETKTCTMVISNAGNADLEFAVSGPEVNPSNLVVNGDFEEGNFGFSTDYSYSPASGSHASGTYSVADDSMEWDSACTVSTKDHTSGEGQMLMAHGGLDEGAVIWQQEVEVIAGVTYEFSAWHIGLIDMASQQCSFVVDGTSLGTPLSEYLTWNEFSAQWTAPESGTVVLSILDVAELPVFIWTVFALDDIVFQAVSAEEASLQVQSTGGEAVPTNGLVADYSFNGDASDSSGNGYDGTVEGATLTTNRFGEADSAYYFDGVNDRIDLPSAVLDFERTNPFSQSFWIRTGDSDNANNILAKMLSSSPGRGVNTLLAYGHIGVQLVNYNSTDNKIRVEGTSVLSDDRWHHVVITYDGSSTAAGIVAYVDGNSESLTVVNDSLTDTILNSTTPSIGSRNSVLYYEGAIDDVCIYDRVLSETEVTALYEEESNSEPDLEAGLVACYPFSGDASDTSTNGYDGTVEGATLITNRFGEADSAYYFDGDDRIDLPSAVLDVERTNTFSRSLWIKSADADTRNNILAKMTSDLASRGNNIVLAYGVLRVQLTSHNTGGNRLVVLGTTILNDDQWHHIVVSYDGSSDAGGLVVYVDGELETLTVQHNTLTGTILNSITPTIGSRNSTYYYTGAIDDVRIYDRVLSGAEALSLYEEEGSGEPDLEAGLVAHYPFSGDASDASGNGNDGIVEGAALIEDHDGNAASAYWFDEGQYIRTTASTGSVDIVGQITMAAWINPEQFAVKAGGAGVNRTILRKRSMYNSYGYNFCLKESGVLSVVFGNSSSPDVANANMDALPTNQWSHVAATYDGTNVVFFVNGVLVDTQAYTDPLLSTSEALCLGRLTDSNDRAYFYGGMDEIRLYNRVLSEAEVLALYNDDGESGGEEPGSGDVVSWLSLDPASGVIAPGESLEIQLTFDAAGLSAGVISNTTLVVVCNDPASLSNSVPVSMVVVSGSLDADEDGMADAWEIRYFGDTETSNGWTDSDGDGQSDYDEYVAGMDPTDAACCFAIYDASIPTNGQFVVYWDSVSGRVYSVQWSAALTNDFTSMATNLVYPQGSYTDTVHHAEESGFYKVEVEME